jgi:hypothetical protein
LAGTALAQEAAAKPRDKLKGQNMRKLGFCLVSLLAISACDKELNIEPTSQGVIQNVVPLNSAALAPIVAAQSTKFVVGTGSINFRGRGGAINGVKVQGDLLSTLGTPDQALVQQFAPMLAKELALYPPGSLQKLGIETIVLTQRVTLNGQPRSAVPLFEQKTMVFDVELGSRGQQIMASIIHHENFHMADFQGDMSTRIDPNWAALNQANFQYGTGGEDMQSQDVTQWDDRIVGLLNRYSTSAIEEDKAELFAAFMWAPNDLRLRASRDAVIANKGKEIIKILSVLDPQFTDIYFRQVAQKRAQMTMDDPNQQIFTPYGWKMKSDIIRGIRR